MGDDSWLMLMKTAAFVNYVKREFVRIVEKRFPRATR
jgi:hypothetical protein